MYIVEIKKSVITLTVFMVKYYVTLNKQLFDFKKVMLVQ